MRAFKEAHVCLLPARSQNLSHQSQVWVNLQLALCLLLLTILQLQRLPPPVSNSSCLFAQCQPLYVSCCTVLLYSSRSCTVRLKMVSLFFMFVMHYLCEEYYKPGKVQYHTANCVRWVPRLTLVDLQIGLANLLSEWNSLI